MLVDLLLRPSLAFARQRPMRPTAAAGDVGRSNGCRSYVRRRHICALVTVIDELKEAQELFAGGLTAGARQSRLLEARPSRVRSKQDLAHASMLDVARTTPGSGMRRARRSSAAYLHGRHDAYAAAAVVAADTVHAWPRESERDTRIRDDDGGRTSSVSQHVALEVTPGACAPTSAPREGRMSRPNDSSSTMSCRKR